MSADFLAGVYPTLSLRALTRPGRWPAYPFDQSDLVLTHLGRGAVWQALAALGLGPGSRLAMPAYHCGSEVEAAHLAGIDIEFYRVDESLTVDEADLARVARNCDAVYLISLFGWPLPEPPPGPPVIADVAHGLFSSDDRGPLGCDSDVTVFCPRKSLGAPDGGAVLVRPPRAAPGRAGGPPPRNRVWRSTAALAAGRLALSRSSAVRHLALTVLGRASRGDAAARRGELTETVIGEWDLEVVDMETAARRPSRMTEHLVRRADGAETRRRRRANYEVLLPRLAHLCPPAFRRLPPGVCPLYLPVMAADRPRAMAGLLASGVRAVEVWPVAHPRLDRSRHAELEPVRRGLLGLPVHQDLRHWHLERIGEAATRVLRA